MSDQEFEQTQQRLHAADPATGAPDPNVAAIRERVLAQTSTADNVVHLRRRRRALVIGSIAAGVALLAGTAVAGAAVGRVTAPVTEAGAPVQQVPEDQLPVVGAPQVSGQLPTVGGNAGGGIAGGGMGGMATGNNLAAGGGPGAPMPMGAPQESGVAGSASTVTSDKMMAPIWGGWGASLVPDPGLSDEAGTAKGYRLVADGVDAKALAEQLAKTFDVKGQPQDQDGIWWVGSQDGSKPTVWVYNDNLVSWNYNDPSQTPYDCVQPVPVETQADGSAGSGGSSSGEAVPGTASSPDECKPADKPMGEGQALKLAKGYLASLGVTDGSADGVDVEWQTASDDYTTSVTAWQRVDGNRTQLAWSFTFGSDALVWASGFAAGLEPIPAFPIIGAKSAVLRSQDPKWSAFGPSMIDGVMPMAAGVKGEVSSDAPAGGSDAATASPSASPSRTSDPTKVEVWWDPVTVTGAEPTLAQYWQPDGTMLLLPAYRLTTADDRGTFAVISVDESAVSFVNQ